MSVLSAYLTQIDFRVISLNEEILTLAEKFIELNILTGKSYDDCLHIAAAIASDMDVVVSWNFSHIVNHKTMQGVKIITAIEAYKDLLIYSPDILVGGDENA